MVMIKFLTCLSVGALVVGGFYYFGRETRHDTVWVENERYRMDFQHQIKLKTMRLNRRDRGPAPEILEKALAGKSVREARLAVLRKELADTTVALQTLGDDFEAFRERRLADLRERALGSEWQEFVTSSGRVLHDAKVISIDDCGVMLRHRDGSARMSYEDLTEEQCCQFGLEEESALAAIHQEHKRARAYESWVKSEADARELEKLREGAERSLNTRSYRPRTSPVRRRYAAPPETASANASPLKIGALGDSRMINENPRYRMRNSSSYSYYYYTAPSYQQFTLPTGGGARRWEYRGGKPSSTPSGGGSPGYSGGTTSPSYSSSSSVTTFKPVSNP